MPLYIATINLTSNKDLILRKFESRKFTKELAPELSPAFTALEIRVVKDLTALYDSAVKSTIPIHKRQGGTLRNQHVQNNISKIRKNNLEGKIWLDDTEHVPPYKTSSLRYSAAKLGETLEEGLYFNLSFRQPISPSGIPKQGTILGGLGVYKRTRDSDAEPGFQTISKGSPTKGWIGQANRQWESQALKYLNTDKDLESFIQSSGVSTETIPEASSNPFEGSLRGLI